MTVCTSTVIAEASDELGLTGTEQNWLNQHPVIRLASDIGWPPFEWVDSNNEFQGIAVDYMKLIESKLGVRFELEKNMLWPQVVEAVKQHKLDVFSCVAKNPQRQEFVNFTRPYLSFPMVIITTQDVSYVDGSEAMKDMQVSVVKGYATHEYLAENHPEIKLTIVNTSEEGLTAVSQGRVDAFVDNIATATRIIQKSGLTNLKISGEMPIRYELAMAVRKDWPELVGILQKALDSISQDQSKHIHNKWIKVRYEHGFDYDLFWKSIVVLVFIIGFLYLYNLKLSREIADRKMAEVNAMKAMDEADKANKAKSQFLAVMSHELRTPLTSIKGALGLLSGGAVEGLPAKAKRLLDIANDNSDRLIRLINDILDIEKLLGGNLVFHNESVNIEQLVEKAATANQGYADHYGVSLAVEYNATEVCTVTADESRLMQVLSNLIANAVKYSPKGGTVRVVTEHIGNKARISVIDVGEGIPEEFRNDLFTHFSQADSSDTREKGGTGLGLAISKEIINRQGGEIGYTTKSGHGTSFYFELKLSRIKGAGEV